MTCKYFSTNYLKHLHEKLSAFDNIESYGNSDDAQIGPSLHAQSQGLDESGTLKYCCTTHQRVLGQGGQDLDRYACKG